MGLELSSLYLHISSLCNKSYPSVKKHWCAEHRAHVNHKFIECNHSSNAHIPIPAHQKFNVEGTQSCGRQTDMYNNRCWKQPAIKQLNLVSFLIGASKIQKQ